MFKSNYYLNKTQHLEKNIEFLLLEDVYPDFFDLLTKEKKTRTQT